MSNLQELMNVVLDPAARAARSGVYVAWVTPAGALPRCETIRSSLDLVRVRLMVADVARCKFQQGFTFSVRPA